MLVSFRLCAVAWVLTLAAANASLVDEHLKSVMSGEYLLEEFLIPMELSQYLVAKEIGASAQRIGEVVAGKLAIAADMHMRGCRFFAL